MPELEIRFAGATRYAESGSGPPLVLIHGVGMNWAYWGPQIERFQDRFHVIAYDMLGHGGSAPPPEGVTLTSYIDQLVGLLDALGIERASIVGHSTGALIATGAAVTRPARVARFAALNMVYDRTPEQSAAILERLAEVEAGGPAAVMERTIRRWFGDDAAALRSYKADLIRQWLAAVDPISYARTYRVYATGDRLFLGRLGGIACPALYLTGELDPNSTPEMSRAAAAATPGGEAVALPGERHMMSFLSPAAVDPVLERFLAGAGG